jgi:hypothetical protein
VARASACRVETTRLDPFSHADRTRRQECRRCRQELPAPRRLSPKSARLKSGPNGIAGRAPGKYRSVSSAREQFTLSSLDSNRRAVGPETPQIRSGSAGSTSGPYRPSRTSAPRSHTPHHYAHRTTHPRADRQAAARGRTSTLMRAADASSAVARSYFACRLIHI